ncbi:hypothetical protein CEXT_252211 [Caerostris extrusa]|uniref:Uncharacterized protein n=1 Tax=Caerostris extrusa TaxID=172846 RepID=A0AAV4W0T9_CAEEX|nr:hypothetical protein CEXT_252211 [Caerostris extrusa]
MDRRLSNIRDLKHCLKHIELCIVPNCKAHSSRDLDLQGFSPHTKKSCSQQSKKDVICQTNIHLQEESTAPSLQIT